MSRDRLSIRSFTWRLGSREAPGSPSDINWFRTLLARLAVSGGVGTIPGDNGSPFGCSVWIFRFKGKETLIANLPKPNIVRYGGRGGCLSQGSPPDVFPLGC